MQLKENEIDDGVEENTNLRGNLEWAPPRPQIVFAPAGRRLLLRAGESDDLAP